MQQTSPKQDSSLKIYLRLLSYLRPFIGLFAVSIVGYMIFASSQPMLAAVLKYFVDGLGAPPETTYHPFPLIGNVQLMYGVPILLVIIIFWRSVGSFFGNYYLARVSLGLINDLRRCLVRQPAAPAERLLRPAELRPPDLAHHLQRDHGHRRRHRCHQGRHPRRADRRLPVRLPALDELAS
jgi:hypothetical protein